MLNITKIFRGEEEPTLHIPHLDKAIEDLQDSIYLKAEELKTNEPSTQAPATERIQHNAESAYIVGQSEVLKAIIAARDQDRLLTKTPK